MVTFPFFQDRFPDFSRWNADIHSKLILAQTQGLIDCHFNKWYNQFSVLMRKSKAKQMMPA